VSAITLSELEFVDQTGREKKTNPIKITITRAGAPFLIFFKPKLRRHLFKCLVAIKNA
jgi:hypothetical protein